MQNISELDLSENKGVRLDEMLVAIRDTCMNLQYLHFAGNKHEFSIPYCPVEVVPLNGLEMLRRLDLGGSLDKSGVLAIIQSSAL